MWDMFLIHFMHYTHFLLSFFCLWVFCSCSFPVCKHSCFSTFLSHYIFGLFSASCNENLSLTYTLSCGLGVFYSLPKSLYISCISWTPVECFLLYKYEVQTWKHFCDVNTLILYCFHQTVLNHVSYLLASQQGFLICSPACCSVCTCLKELHYIPRYLAQSTKSNC